MCGIAGEIRFDGAQPDRSTIERMTEAICHRGPDGRGFRFMPGVGFGHRRLSIVDPENGAQPMTNETGDISVVFNGEIYNSPDLREWLRDCGHRFETGCDTEVLVHLYEDHGAGMLPFLNGMFAFAIWDEVRQRGLVARDRLGMKPLYYALDSDRLVFASELKAMRLASGVSSELDPIALDAYLALHYIPAPLSILKAVRKLPHGHAIEIEHGRASIREYWRPDATAAATAAAAPSADAAAAANADTSGENGAIERLRNLLEHAVEDHLMSDVPVGMFLSGGVDSSVVAALAARVSGRPLRTFTIRFEDPRYDEGPFARRVADHIGSDHTEGTVQADAIRLLPELVRIYDEPFGDPAALPGYHLARLAARDVKVCLSGDGGDELFGGYSRYFRSLRLARYDRAPANLRRAVSWVGAGLIPEHVPGHHLARKLGEPASVRYLREFGGFDALARQDLLVDRSRSSGAEDSSFFDAYFPDAWNGPGLLMGMQRADLNRYLPECILTKVDRISMAHSLEVRPPILDHRVVEMALALPESVKIRDGSGKWILKEVGRDLLPPEVLDRRKRGFTVPLTEWFRGNIRSFAEGALLGPEARSREILRPAAVRKVLDLHTRGNRSFSEQIWSLLFLEFWCRAFLGGDS